MNRRSLVLLILLAALWGASYLFIKIGLRSFSAAEITSIRCGLAALVLFPLALRRGALKGLGRRAPEVALLGAIHMGVPLTLIGLGEKHISSSLASILVAASPISTAILAPFLDKDERSSGMRAVGIVIGIVGVVLLFGLDLSGDSKAVLGGLMVVLAGLGYALAGFIVKRRFKGVQPIGLVTGTTLSASLLLLPFAIATSPGGTPQAGPSRRRGGARRGRHGHRLPHLLHAAQHGRAGKGVARGLRRARVLGGLRRGVPQRELHDQHVRGPGADPGRVVARSRRPAPAPDRGRRGGHRGYFTVKSVCCPAV